MKEIKLVLPSQVDEYLDKFEYSTNEIKDKTKKLYKYSMDKTDINLNTAYLIAVVQFILSTHLLKNKEDRMLSLTDDFSIIYNINSNVFWVLHTFDINTEYFLNIFNYWCIKPNIHFTNMQITKVSKEYLYKTHYVNKPNNKEDSYDTNGETDIVTKNR